MDLINKTLRKLGYKIKKKQHYMSFLLEKSDHVFILDSLPKIVGRDRANKYSQFEIISPRKNEYYPSKKTFFTEEQKYIETIKKIWLYSKLKVEVLSNIGIGGYNKKSCNLLGKIKKINEKQKFYKVTNMKELVLLIKNGFRKCSDMDYYFEDLNVIFSPSCSYFLVCFITIEHFDLIEKIANVEGLHLRKQDE